MKNILKYSLFSMLMGLLVFATSCEDKQWSENYDGNYPVPQITSLSQKGDVSVGSTITVTGTNFTGPKSDVNTAPKVTIKGVACEVKSYSATSLEIILPRVFEKAPIVVTNVFDRFGVSTDEINPSYPNVAVSQVKDIPIGLNFTIIGTNVDVITNVYVNGVEAPIVKRVSPTSIQVSSAALKLIVGQLVNVTFKALSSNSIPAVANVNVNFPSIDYREIVILDFEDGVNPYVGEGTATIQSAGANTPPGNTDKYLQLRAPGYSWDKSSGEIRLKDNVDVSQFVSPYLTFYVRTPKGSDGYFQLEDQQGNWRHFNYSFATDGEWKLISQPLDKGWEGGAFRASAFKPCLTFKAGNAGVHQDVDIAYMKITEGAYDNALVPGDQIGSSAYPPHIDLMNFEDALLTPDLLNGTAVVGSVDFRHTGADLIAPFNGNNFFTFVDDGSIASGSWGAYWGSSLNINTSMVDFKPIPHPNLSFQMNTGTDKGQQYIVLRFVQYEGGLQLVKKFFPNSNGTWTPGQVALFDEELENWSDDATDLGKHYKSLKKLNKDVPLDRIEVIACKNDTHDIIISLDEFTVTDGPRY